MKSIKQRDYTCKDEELPALCKFTTFSLRRDQSDFAAYSPRFNKDYITGFESRIVEATEVVEPRSEMLEQKMITARLHATLDELLLLASRVGGYLKLARPVLTISSADFGLAQLRRSIGKRDAEGVVKNLHTVMANIAMHKEVLMAQGLSDELIAQLNGYLGAVAADKQKQYEIFTNRKSTVQENLALLNGLNKQLRDILTVGKILYKNTDQVKNQEYTFTELVKRVRRAARIAAGKPAVLN